MDGTKHTSQVKLSNNPAIGHNSLGFPDGAGRECGTPQPVLGSVIRHLAPGLTSFDKKELVGWGWSRAPSTIIPLLASILCFVLEGSGTRTTVYHDEHTYLHSGWCRSSLAEPRHPFGQTTSVSFASGEGTLPCSAQLSVVRLEDMARLVPSGELGAA